ncbi:hypothetical protein OSTOST_23532 [Ostertagia ostertagi]
MTSRVSKREMGSVSSCSEGGLVTRLDNSAALSEQVEQLWSELQGDQQEQNALETITALDTQLMMDEAIETALRSQLNNNIATATAALTLASSPPRNASSGNQSLDACGMQPIQLRKLELPVFDGDLTQFHDFWCRFKTAIHDNDSFDPSKPENYHLAIQALKKRYDRPQFTHNLFHHRFEDTTTSLSLMKLIKSKFPRDTQLEVNRLEHRSGKKWTLPDLLDGLNEVIEEFEKLDDYSIGKSLQHQISM